MTVQGNGNTPAAPAAAVDPNAGGVSGTPADPGAAAGAAPPAQGSASGQPPAGEGQIPGAAPAGEPGPAAPAATDWKDRRIAKLTAQLRETQAQVAAAPAAAPAPVAPAGPAPGSQEFSRAVQIAAQQQAEIAAFNSRCDAAAGDGRQRFGQQVFDGAVMELMKLVDREDPSTLLAYNSFLTAALEAGDAPAVILELSQNLNEASRVLNLPPVKMAVELTNRVNRMKNTEAASGQQPAPARPLHGAGVGNRGGVHTPISPSDPARAGKLPAVDWFARRDAEVEERRKQKMGG